MSKVGKKPIEIPEGVEVRLADGVLNFKGKRGDFSLKVLPYTKAEIKDNQLIFSPLKNMKQAKANWGTIAALARNAIKGVNEGFGKSLKLEGVGFRAAMEGKNLKLSVGFSHPVIFNPSEKVNVSVEKNLIKISGIDKELVGETAAQIRRIRKPEPYKGKGIRYENEVVRKKAGKKAATAAA